MKADIWTNVFGSLGPTSRALSIYWTTMENPTAEQLSEWGLEAFPQHMDIILASQEESQIGADTYPALLNTLQKANSSETYMQYFVIHGNEVYRLEFYLRNKNDKDKAMPVFNRMLASFNILE